METIRGRTSRAMDSNELHGQLSGYQHVILDLGTGDGRYVHDLARRHPDWFVIGVDSCRENLHEYSRANLPNMIFAIAQAQDLPDELDGLASHITINFPWGSLLKSLMTGDPTLMHGLESISRPGTRVDIHLNGGALAEVNMALDAGAELVRENINRHGWDLGHPSPMDRHALRDFPSTWAKRLAFGRDPRAISMNGSFAGK